MLGAASVRVLPSSFMSSPVGKPSVATMVKFGWQEYAIGLE